MEFLMNQWYVAAFAKDVTTKPIKQMIAGQSVVLYRTEEGYPCALDDRCPHRFAPLHKGQVVGSNIECPYHGLQFDGRSGLCVLSPHGDGKIPSTAKVRRYPLVERDGLIWIWPGNPALAAAEKVLDLTSFFDAENRSLIAGYYKLKAHVEVVLDNLMDLSHAPFLHPTTLANRDDVKGLRFEMLQEGDVVIANHWLKNVLVSPQFRPFWKFPTLDADGRANMRWNPPSNLQLDVGYTGIGNSSGGGVDLHFAHLLTPASDSETHYFWVSARNFAIGDEAVSEFMEGQVKQAFETEDEPMIEAVADYMGTPDLLSLNPVLLAGDAAAVRVRRVLQQLRQRECAHAQAA
ncbi:aromatic ring-hydroxylating dioxygenase subunit alpha [Sulfuritalea sp.]|uniref:aromatic ring-hydroxylating dioxygenase subunit alpha n=1 Tax=Sulfuritalea sp. TaxID=2480090 RepID=UPI001AC4E57B|nr:aromatic ring-hydroxylating dioxygenase subunit alpha [Sulfuritalea sp.]MBN8476329.1 aromatic ring-hydroxylating dioxygenase subunit alpha [Sulfuritalea sp.]